jgi:hypothetical protein
MRCGGNRSGQSALIAVNQLFSIVPIQFLFQLFKLVGLLVSKLV